MTWINITDIKTISPKLKERFCKDCNIPIKIFEEPYFLERLKLYHKQFDTLNKWMKFLLELEKYKSEQDYFEEYNRVKEAAIGAIKNSNGYKDFLELDMSKLPFHVNFYDITSKDIFHPDNDGRIFISIDMKQANYSSLNKFSADIFGYKDSWEVFLRQFTNNEHIINSKYIRQVILGNCNPRKQVTYEKGLMSEVCAGILNISAGKLLFENIVSFSNDEIVIDVTDISNFHTLYVRIENYCHFNSNDRKPPLHVEIFKLKKIKGIDGYIKESMTENNIEIKGVDSNYLPLVIRKLKKEKIRDNDLVFIHNGYLAKLIDIPKIEV